MGLMKKKLEDDADRKRKELEDEERRLRELAEQELENERRRKEAELRGLEDKLNREAEENRLKQKGEIMQILEGDSLEILKMKDQVLVLVGKQERIGHIRQKRRELYTIPEDEETRDDCELNGLVDKTAELFNALLSNETQITRLKDEVDQKDPKDVMKEVVNMENELNLQSEKLKNISGETDDIYKKHQLMLDEGIKRMSAEDAKKQEMLSNLEDGKAKIKTLKEGIYNIQTTQEQIGDTMKETMNMILINEEDTNLDESELKNLLVGTSELNESVLRNEQELSDIEADIHSKDPGDLTSHLKKV